MCFLGSFPIRIKKNTDEIPGKCRETFVYVFRQPLNCNRRIVQKSARTDGQKRLETESPKSVRKRAKKCGNEQKQVQRAGAGVRKRLGCFLLLVFWPYSSGHLGFSYIKVFLGWVGFRWKFPSFISDHPKPFLIKQYLTIVIMPFNCGQHDPERTKEQRRCHSEKPSSKKAFSGESGFFSLGL